MSIIKSILDSTALQQLQLCLALWQVMNLTPVGVFLQSIIGCLLLPLARLLLPLGRLLQPLGLSPTTVGLQYFQGRLFKRVRCHRIRKSDSMALPCRLHHQLFYIQSSYLGKKIVLERREGNKLFVNGKMCYYITDAISASLLDMVNKALTTVFLKDYEEVWEQTVVGRVMTFEEVLDSLILDNCIIQALNNDYLLPVSLSFKSEEPLLTILNLLGILLQYCDVYWVIPPLLSIISGVLEFFTTFRKWLYAKINMIFCCAMHFMCDRLPYSLRRRLYVLGLLEAIQLRVARGHTISAVIAGGAKASKADATLVADGYEFSGQADEEGAALVPYGHRFVASKGYVEIENAFKCADIEIKCKRRFVYVEDAALAAEYEFLGNEACAEIVCAHRWKRLIVEGSVEASTRDGVVIFKFDIDFKTNEEFMKMSTFLSCFSKYLPGSLECQGFRNKLRVRSVRESIMCYVRNGYPPVYTLQLHNALVR